MAAINTDLEILIFSIDERWNKFISALQNAEGTVVKRKPKIEKNNWYDQECR